MPLSVLPRMDWVDKACYLLENKVHNNWQVQDLLTEETEELFSWFKEVWLVEYCRNALYLPAMNKSWLDLQYRLLRLRNLTYSSKLLHYWCEWSIGTMLWSTLRSTCQALQMRTNFLDRAMAWKSKVFCLLSLHQSYHEPYLLGWDNPGHLSWLLTKLNGIWFLLLLLPGWADMTSFTSVAQHKTRSYFLIHLRLIGKIILSSLSY